MACFKTIIARKQTFEWRFVKTLPAFAARAGYIAGVLIASALLSGVAGAQVPQVTGPIPAVGPPGTDLTHNYPQLASAPKLRPILARLYRGGVFLPGYRDAIPGTGYCQWTSDIHGRCDRGVDRQSVQDPDARQTPGKPGEFQRRCSGRMGQCDLGL